MKTHKAHCRIYNIDFLFVTYTRREKNLAERKLDLFFGEKGNEIDPGANAMCFSMQNGSKIAIATVRAKRERMIAWMAHESLHAAQHVYRWRYVNWSIQQGEHESQCYYMEWIMSECMKTL